MQTQALVFMLVSEGIIIGLSLYFFIKVLFTKPKDEPDSYTNE